MRTLMRVEMDTETANPRVADGSLQKAMMEAFAQLKPEATYFALENGCRNAYIVFDMKDASQIPSLVEPMFQGAQARISLVPVMNLDDLQHGMQEAAKH